MAERLRHQGAQGSGPSEKEGQLGFAAEEVGSEVEIEESRTWIDSGSHNRLAQSGETRVGVRTTLAESLAASLLSKVLRGWVEDWAHSNRREAPGVPGSTAMAPVAAVVEKYRAAKGTRRVDTLLEPLVRNSFEEEEEEEL